MLRKGKSFSIVPALGSSEMILWDTMVSVSDEFSLLLTHPLWRQENFNLCDQLSYKLERENREQGSIDIGFVFIALHHQNNYEIVFTAPWRGYYSWDGGGNLWFGV